MTEELNRELAERLFGWKRCRWALCGKWYQEPNTYHKDHAFTMFPPADYAGTWEGMGLVLEEMRERRWRPFVAWEESCRWWRAGVLVGELRFTETAETAPEAVARAVLAALRSEAVEARA